MNDVATNLQLQLLGSNEMPSELPGHEQDNRQADNAPHREHLERIYARRMQFTNCNRH